MHEQLQQFTHALESVLREQVKLHEALLELLQRRREALRMGNNAAIAQLCSLENEKVQAISELEKQRLALVAQLTLVLDPQANEPLRMGVLAERLPEPMRGRLLVLRQQLVQRMTQVRDASSVARRATDTLMRHMQGLVQSISRISTGVSTYGNRGNVPTSAAPLSTMSVTA